MHTSASHRLRNSTCGTPLCNSACNATRNALQTLRPHQLDVAVRGALPVAVLHSRHHLPEVIHRVQLAGQRMLPLGEVVREVAALCKLLQAREGWFRGWLRGTAYRDGLKGRL